MSKRDSHQCKVKIQNKIVAKTLVILTAVKDLIIFTDEILANICDNSGKTIPKLFDIFVKANISNIQKDEELGEEVPRYPCLGAVV